MPKGDIGAVIETKDIVSNNMLLSYNCIKLSDGYYMVAFKDNDSDGQIATFPINESTGDIGNTIDTWEFANGDTTNSVRLIKISSTTYAIVYSLVQTVNKAYVKTFTVSDAGVITKSFTDSLELPLTKDEPSLGSDIIHISGNVYAIVYSERNGADPYWGNIVTVTITPAGAISDAVLDYLDFANRSASEVSICRVGSTDFYVIASTDANRYPSVTTVEISSAGVIAATVTDVQVLDTVVATMGNIIRITGTNWYVVAVAVAGAAGTIYTCSINSAGAITNGSSGNFDSVDAEQPHMVNLGSDAFAVAYRGVDNDGFLVSLTVSNLGVVSSVIESLEFLTSDLVTPFILYLGHGNYAITYGNSGGDDLECVTIGMATGAIFPTDAITRVTSLIHRYDRGTYTLELLLGEVVSDFGLPEWMSKPKEAISETEEERMREQDRRLWEAADRLKGEEAEREGIMREQDRRLWGAADKLREEEARREEAMREQDRRLWEAADAARREQAAREEAQRRETEQMLAREEALRKQREEEERRRQEQLKLYPPPGEREAYKTQERGAGRWWKSPGER